MGNNDEEMKSIIINDKYKLVPFDNVRKDDIEKVLNKRTFYVCNFADEMWYKYQKFTQKKNSSIEKKTRYYEVLGKDSYILSPTSNNQIKRRSKNFRNDYVIHFGSGIFWGRFGQLYMTLKILYYVFTRRKEFDLLLSYNFYFPYILIGIFSKYILKKEFVIDFEDDYTLTKRNKFKNLLFNLIKGTPDVVICIHEEMTKQFKKNVTSIVFNGFIDLDYSVDHEFYDGMTFLFSGTLDDIRGADLLPDLCNALSQVIDNFRIYVCGSGPLEDKIRNWNNEKIVFKGFLTNLEYKRLLSESDAFLVLQKPDHPFSRGSFPSKIEQYSSFKKPIYSVDQI